MSAAATSQPNYFAGEFLSVADYAAEQAYRIAIQRAGSAALNTAGIVHGLDVSTADGTVTVTPGIAFDASGRLLLLDATLSATVPADDAAVLTIAGTERYAAGTPGQLGTVTEGVALGWHATMASVDPLREVVIASGTPPGPAGRCHAGVPAGTVRFHHAGTFAVAAVSGWSAPPLVGVRIAADPLVIAAPADSAGGLLAVQGGTLGIGTLSAQACCDILAPAVALDGPGLLTSFDTVVRGTTPRLGTTLHVGDAVIANDRDGVRRRARVVRITAATEFIADAPLNCVDAPFTFEQALIAAVAGPDAADALAIDPDGRVGLGTAVPQAALHLGTGDLEIGGEGSQLRFERDGGVRTGDRASSIAWRHDPPRTGFAQQGRIVWQPGLALAVPPVGMVLDPLGRLGIGTAQPQDALDITGTLRLQDGGLIFPDGTVQAAPMISVPVGGVIDWWQGMASNLPPDDFAICAGGVVDDPRSPFDGMAVPDLSDCFVYGATGDTQSAIGADQHQHALATPAHVHAFPHTHPDVGGTTEGANNSDGMAGAPDNNAAAGHAHGWTGTVGQTDTQYTGTNGDAGQPVDTDSASTLPPFVALLKLIRIR